MIEVEVNTILKAVAVDSAGNWGNVSEVLFNITDVVNVESTLVSEIQSLLDNAEPYSKILFEYGVVEGANFTVNKPLNIISNNNTKLIGNGNQPVFTFTENAKGSILNGFAINNTNSGILIKDTGNITVKNCRVNVSDGIGINIINTENITVKSTEVCGCEEGIIVNKSDSTVLDDVHVIDCYSDGIWIYQSTNTSVVNSVVEDNGKDPYKVNRGNMFMADGINGLRFVVNVPASQSRANNILIDDSSNTNILNNTINRGYFGIRLYHNTDGVVIDRNTIYECVGDAILLSNRYLNVNITHNLIDGCYNGIDFMGYSENVTIKQNTIKLLHAHDGDLYNYPVIIEQMAGYVYETYFPGDQFFNHRNNGIQVSYPARNFDEGNTIIVDNVVIRLSHRSWEARKYTGYIDAGCDSYGYNLMDGSSSYSLTDFGGATSYHEGKVDLVLDRIGDAKFRLRLINRLDDHYLSEIPEFDVIFTAGGFTQTVKFINDSAIAEFDVAMAVSDIEAIISGEIRKSAHFDIPISEGYSSTNRPYDPGFERGEAYNNPDPVIPKIPPEEDDYKPVNPTNPVNPVIPVVPEEPETGYGNGTGNGQGNGTGQGTGTGDGNGSSGSFGNGTSNILTDIISDTPGMIGDSAENITDEIKSENVISNVEDSSEIGEATTTESSDDSEGMDRSREGGSDAGNGETVNAYEVSKVINVDESNWQFVAAVILFAVIIILGYGYRRGKKDGDEF
ncbi:MAG: right-handed parallel beta-helix repeat-containing protein [Methanobrevibacter sp.]|nr:right-handed parallel beta-helix repeat-containing protein [Methanobrevibacter sp.]